MLGATLLDLGDVDAGEEVAARALQEASQGLPPDEAQRLRARLLATDVFLARGRAKALRAELGQLVPALERGAREHPGDLVRALQNRAQLFLENEQAEEADRSPPLPCPLASSRGCWGRRSSAAPCPSPAGNGYSRSLEMAPRSTTHRGWERPGVAPRHGFESDSAPTPERGSAVTALPELPFPAGIPLARNQASAAGVMSFVGEREKSAMAADPRNSIAFLPGPAGDRALVARLEAGEDEAFRECYEAHAPPLLRLLVRVLRNRALAEEVLQETFISAFRGISQFRGETRLATWLTGIALRRGLNALRGESRRERSVPPAESSHCPESRLAERDVTRRVLALLDEMDPHKRAVLLLQAEGHTAAEIAAMMHEPRGTILSRLARGRAELAERAAAAGLSSSATPPQARSREKEGQS